MSALFNEFIEYLDILKSNLNTFNDANKALEKRNGVLEQAILECKKVAEQYKELAEKSIRPETTAKTYWAIKQKDGPNYLCLRGTTGPGLEVTSRSQWFSIPESSFDMVKFYDKDSAEYMASSKFWGMGVRLEVVQGCLS